MDNFSFYKHSEVWGYHMVHENDGIMKIAAVTALMSRWWGIMGWQVLP
jgi:hypothetical protein